MKAFVRPHNVRLVKLQLEIPSHEAVTVQLTRTEAESVGLAMGDKVVVDMADAKIFLEDYSI